MLPVMESISNTSSILCGRSIPYSTVSVSGPLALTAKTSVPEEKKIHADNLTGKKFQ